MMHFYFTRLNFQFLNNNLLCARTVGSRTPTLQQLLNALKKLENWFMFGATLGVPVSQLKKIESNHHKDSDRCKLEMLQYWLDSNSDTTWNEIVQGLEETDQLALANQIKHNLESATVNEEEGTYI